MPPLLTPDSPRFISVEVDDRYHFALKRGKLLDGDSITGFCFSSVKAGITPPPQNVALDGYDQLVKDFNRPNPEILFFTQERLREARDFDQLERFDRVAALSEPVDRLYRLILVFDQEAWKESVIEQLNEHRTPDLPDFAAYLLLGTALRDTVSLCYALAQKKYFV